MLPSEKSKREGILVVGSPQEAQKCLSLSDKGKYIFQGNVIRVMISDDSKDKYRDYIHKQPENEKTKNSLGYKRREPIEKPRSDAKKWKPAMKPVEKRPETPVLSPKDFNFKAQYLTKDITIKDLQTYFEPFGDIRKVYIQESSSRKIRALIAMKSIKISAENLTSSSHRIRSVKFDVVFSEVEKMKLRAEVKALKKIRLAKIQKDIEKEKAKIKEKERKLAREDSCDRIERTVLVRNFPSYSRSSEAMNYFSKFGRIADVLLMNYTRNQLRDIKQNRSQRCEVVFNRKKDAERYLKQGPNNYCGRNLQEIMLKDLEKELKSKVTEKNNSMTNFNVGLQKSIEELVSEIKIQSFKPKDEPELEDVKEQDLTKKEFPRQKVEIVKTELDATFQNCLPVTQLHTDFIDLTQDKFVSPILESRQVERLVVEATIARNLEQDDTKSCDTDSEDSHIETIEKLDSDSFEVADLPVSVQESMTSLPKSIYSETVRLELNNFVEHHDNQDFKPMEIYIDPEIASEHRLI